MPTKWLPQQTAAVASRLVRTYEQTPQNLRDAGAQFYPLWNETAEHIGTAIGKTTEHGAAILAHLSPSNEAEMNRMQGMQIAHSMSDKALAAMVKAGEHSTMAKSFEVRSRSAVPGSPEHSSLLAEHAKHTAEVQRLRGVAGVVGTPLGNLGSREMGNAARVILGEHDDDPLGSLGSMKIRDFGGDIADPSSPRVAIDTHYHDAAVGRQDIPYQANRGLEAVGRYESFQHASSLAHERVRAMGIDIPHPAFMGGVWYQQQQVKAQNNPNARKSRLASESKIARVRADPANQAFLPESHGLPPSFNKISV